MHNKMFSKKSILIFMFSFFYFTFISFNNVSALSFDFTKIPFFGILFQEQNIPVSPDQLKEKLGSKVDTNIVTEKIIIKNISQNKNENTEKTLDYEDLLKQQNSQKEIQAKMKLLLMNTEEKNSVENTCKFSSQEEIDNCKKDLFVGCAESLYLGFDMASECKQFSTEDYLNFINIKKKQIDEKINESEILQTKLGEIKIINSEDSQKNVIKTEKDETINSSSINDDLSIKSKKIEVEEKKIVQSVKPIQKIFKIFWNTKMPVYYSGWVTGWGTLFATNGGEKESGQEMNDYTAFGYNPYNSSVCIVSLPYKTVDKFFGTNLNSCIKNKDISCILRIKTQLKNRAIEVVMIKNGKRTILPLGDFGPAEWTGNAIDFTSCARKTLGATGKDLVKFRPLPY